MGAGLIISALPLLSPSKAGRTAVKSPFFFARTRSADVPATGMPRSRAMFERRGRPEERRS